MEEFEEICTTCKYRNIEHYDWPCNSCDDLQRWENPINGWLVEWLSSFDTNSATECFTAVNLLKQRLENADD